MSPEEATGPAADGLVRTGSEPVVEDEVPWEQLSPRMIWVDALQTLLSLTPAGLAVWVFDVEASWGSMWPFIAIAVFGVLGAITDVWRWLFTRYRVGSDYVERRTGILVRQYRSVRRDRIRSVDVDARLRHRLSGLRVVQIGAGQQAVTGESAFELDAVRADEAEHLQRILLREARRRPHGAGQEDRPDAAGQESRPDGDGEGARSAAGSPGELPTHEDGEIEQVRPPQVLARLDPRWIVYNLVNIWALVMAIGLMSGVYWLALTFNLNLTEYVVEWSAHRSWGERIAVGAAAVGLVGVAGMAVTFFTSHWNFELSRVFGTETTMLRTRQGLLRTREVNRDEARTRGIAISEPVLWRWLGVTDTTVITTGLNVWSSSDPTTILPRGPKDVAHKVSGAALQAEPNPLLAALTQHPPAALRRRLWWATVTTAAVTGVLAWLALTDVLPPGVVWVGAGLLPLAVLAAVVAYRALGHTIAGPYVVMRSGLFSRKTTALQRTAVSTIEIRESLLQRRLGLQTVATMTAAGDGAYEAPDVSGSTAVDFANTASAGLLEPFLVPEASPTD